MSRKYLRGDIVRTNGGEEYLVVEDEGTDRAGQVLMRRLEVHCYMTRNGKPGRVPPRCSPQPTKGAPCPRIASP